MCRFTSSMPLVSAAAAVSSVRRSHLQGSRIQAIRRDASYRGESWFVPQCVPSRGLTRPAATNSATHSCGGSCAAEARAGAECAHRGATGSRTSQWKWTFCTAPRCRRLSPSSCNPERSRCSACKPQSQVEQRGVRSRRATRVSCFGNLDHTKQAGQGASLRHEKTGRGSHRRLAPWDRVSHKACCSVTPPSFVDS